MQDTEGLWFTVTLDLRLSLNICASYHQPKPLYDVSILKQHLADNISSLSVNDPNSIFVLTGDLNRLNSSELQTNLGLEQIVNIPTYNDNILGQFITNRSDQFVDRLHRSVYY